MIGVLLWTALGFSFFPAMASEMPFDQALTEMVDTNVDVRVQQTKANASESQIWAARGALGPTVSLAAQQQNAGGSAFSQTNGSNLTNGQIYSASATWNIFRSGADWAALNAAFNDRRYQYATLDDLKLQAETKAAQALLDLIEKKMAVEVYKRAETNARRFAEIAEQRFQKSLLPHEDMDKVTLDAANSEARRADAESQLFATRSTVESLLGHASVQSTWPWEKRLLEHPRELEWTASEATAHRPDFQASQTSVETEDARRKSLFRNMLPTVDLNYTQSREVMPRESINGWSSTATLTIPLWNGYHDYSAYRTQVEVKAASEAKLSQLRRTIDGDIHTAQDNYRIAYQQYTTRLKNLQIAKHIMDQDAARFRIGRADANDLSLDLSRVTNAEILAIQGIEQAHLAYLSLKHAFGERVLE